MAKEILTRLVDDLDGSEADETVTFGLDGKQYEIDLTAKHAERLRRAVAPFMEAARGVKRSGGTRRVAVDHRGWTPVEVREWAEKQGIELAARGRIPTAVVEQYLGRKRR